MAKKVSENDVLKVVRKVLIEENKDFKKNDDLIPSGLENDTAIYIATFKGGGFIVLSADDVATPILALNFLGKYNNEEMPLGFLYLLEKYQYSIKDLKDRKVEQSDRIKNKWEKYLLDNQVSGFKSINTVNSNYVLPIIETSWRQYGYNQFCPDDTCAAGCTAVALARILYHWRAGVYPTGSNTYDGQTANFGTTNYHWCSMSKTSADDYNELLIYHAGVSCNTKLLCVLEFCVIFNNFKGSKRFSRFLGDECNRERTHMEFK